MNEKLLKLQAHLDGELSTAESKQVAGWLASDQQARAIYEELRATKSLLTGNEVELKLPETHDFYWSKIAREINRLNRAPQTSPPRFSGSWWMRLAAPFAIAALAAVLFISVVKLQSGSRGMTRYFQEIETPLEESNAISFHSDAANMRVVWIPSQEN
ncbi:MAG: hypothetical protein EXS30_01840 [Pedosphaera sp.]|nr:hypothetical protein [Pedosphaera sp.]